MNEKKLLYHRKYNINRYYRIRKWMFSIIGDRCVKCGKKATQVDHKKNYTKRFEVSRCFSLPKLVLAEELNKCQPLCKKCHIEKSIKESGKISAKGTHGTLSSYKYCHCKKCKKAKNKWTIEYRKTHPRKRYHGRAAMHLTCNED